MNRFCHSVSRSGGSTPVISDLNLLVDLQNALCWNGSREQIVSVMLVMAPAHTSFQSAGTSGNVVYTPLHKHAH